MEKHENEIPVNYWEYPFTGFSFMVKLVKSLDANNPTDFEDHECNFQEVSGLNITLDTEEVNEGGENMFAHRIPSRPKFQNLVLKRGMLNYADSGLIKWAQDSISKFSFTPKMLNVILMDEKKNPLASWVVIGAYPVGIKVSDFKSMEDSIVVETLELAFDYLKRIN